MVGRLCDWEEVKGLHCDQKQQESCTLASTTYSHDFNPSKQLKQSKSRLAAPKQVKC